MKPDVPFWPTGRDAVEPFGDQDAIDDRGWEDHRAAGGKLRPEVYDALAERLLGHLDAVIAGRVALDGALRAELDHLLNTLRISRKLTPDRRTERPVAPFLPSDADLVRVTTDLCPAAAVEAGDRVLGPLVDELDARRPAHALALRVAVAAYCFVIADGERDRGGLGLDPGQTPFEQWTRRRPLPSVEERAAFRAIERAPFTAWALHSQVDADGWILEERVGIDARGVPSAPVRLVGVAAPWRAPRAGDTLVARVVEGPNGWETRTPLVIPGGPPAARLRSWVRLELVRQRLRLRNLTVDELLRRRGFLLARRLVEWGWLHGDDDPYGVPELYDLEYHDHGEDIAFYVGLARTHGGPVLELGCGTGRLSLALARAGAEVHGVDLSDSMLRALADKVAAEPPAVRQRVSWSRDDFRTVARAPVHPLVIVPFNALHHCRSDDELVALFRSTVRALAPGGRVAFDCYLADLELYDRDPDARYEERTFVDPRSGETLRSWEQGWWDADARVHHVVYVYEHADGRQERSHLQLRMYELEELRAAVRRAGLRIVSEAQDFAGKPLDDDALKYVVVATRAG